MPGHDAPERNTLRDQREQSHTQNLRVFLSIALGPHWPQDVRTGPEQASAGHTEQAEHRGWSSIQHPGSSLETTKGLWVSLLLWKLPLLKEAQ